MPDRFGSGRLLIEQSEALHIELLLAVERLDTFVQQLRCEADRRDANRAISRDDPGVSDD